MPRCRSPAAPCRRLLRGMPGGCSWNEGKTLRGAWCESHARLDLESAQEVRYGQTLAARTLQLGKAQHALAAADIHAGVGNRLNATGVAALASHGSRAPQLDGFPVQRGRRAGKRVEGAD